MLFQPRICLSDLQGLVVAFRSQTLLELSRTLQLDMLNAIAEPTRSCIALSTIRELL